MSLKTLAEITELVTLGRVCCPWSRTAENSRTLETMWKKKAKDWKHGDFSVVKEETMYIGGFALSTLMFRSLGLRPLVVTQSKSADLLNHRLQFRLLKQSSCSSA